MLEGNIDSLLPEHVLAKDQTRNLGLCPDCGWSLQPFGARGPRSNQLGHPARSIHPCQPCCSRSGLSAQSGTYTHTHTLSHTHTQCSPGAVGCLVAFAPHPICTLRCHSPPQEEAACLPILPQNLLSPDWFSQLRSPASVCPTQQYFLLSNATILGLENKNVYILKWLDCF